MMGNEAIVIAQENMTDPFVLWTTIAAIVGAFAAAAGAIFAGCAIRLDLQWRRRNRTFLHSPYRNENLLDAINKLKDEYSEMGMTQKMFWEELKNSSSNKQVLKNLKEGKVDSVVYVANLWGQMASEYYAGLLDKKIAKNILRYNFMKFCFVFEKWLSHPDRMGTYEKTMKLYRKWQSRK